MIRKNKQSKTQSVLSDWLGRAPVRFALTAVFVPLALILLYLVIAAATVMPGMPVPTWPIGLFGLIGFAIAFCRLIRQLPNTPLDRASFVAIDTGAFLTVRLLGLTALIAMAFFYFPMLATFSSPFAHLGMTIGMTGLMLALVCVGSYVLGLQIVALNAIYWRARAMGVSKIKALLSLPCSMLWFSGYLLDDSDKKRTVAIRARGFAALVDWIVATPSNAWTMFIIMLGISGLFYGFGWTIWPLLVVPFVLFTIWLLMVGPDRMRRGINGTFATVAVIVNILTLVTLITVNVMVVRTLRTTDASVEITLSETRGLAQ